MTQSPEEFENGADWLAWKQELQADVPESVGNALRHTIRNFDPALSNLDSVESIRESLQHEHKVPVLASRFAIFASTFAAVAASIALLLVMNRARTPATVTPVNVSGPMVRAVPKSASSMPITMVSVRSPRYATRLSSTIQNASFEERFNQHLLPESQPIPDWYLPNECRKAGYRLQLDSTNPTDGDSCLRIEFAGSGSGYFGTVMQTLDASPFVGKTIRLWAMMRIEPDDDKGQAHMWLRIDNQDGSIGFFGHTEDRPIRSPIWQRIEIVGTMSNQAQTLNIGMFLLGKGTAWVDDVHLEIVE
jgi:hypothetical protein